MRRMFWICLFVFGLIVSWTLVCAADFYVIPTKKKNYAPVEKTGQTTLYTAGDDGDLEKGVTWPDPRFTDNGDGTVTDNLTGLIWLKNANCPNSIKTWNNAVVYAAVLYDGCTHCGGDDNDCGLSDDSSAGDWRLPNVKELQSLIDYGSFNPALPTAHPFTNVQSHYYWSSTTYAGNISSASYMAMGNGHVFFLAKSNSYYVWPVRGGN